MGMMQRHGGRMKWEGGSGSGASLWRLVVHDGLVLLLLLGILKHETGRVWRMRGNGSSGSLELIVRDQVLIWLRLLMLWLGILG